MLDDFGLARALEGCVEQFQRQTGIRTHLAAAGPLDSVREDCAIHVYRIVQEALNNAARHSGSPDAWVRIDCGDGDLQLDVEDHGSGIAVAAPAGGAERGMGMVSMRERAELIGGELHVSPAQGGGHRRAAARPRLSRRPPRRGGLTMAIRVLLADDHALVRQGFRRILEDEKDIEVVGEAGGGAEAVTLDQQLEPDVVVLDMSMPEINGLHAAIEILRRRPDRPIMILSMFDDAQYVRNALAAGVRGYILKNALETDLLRAVRTVAAGGKRFLSAGAGRRRSRARRRDETAAEDERFAQLTAREIQVLRLIAMGKTNREIGTMLGLSANTVAVHRTNLMSTLGVHKAAELVLIAVRKGLVNLQ